MNQPMPPSGPLRYLQSDDSFSWFRFNLQIQFNQFRMKIFSTAALLLLLFLQSVPAQVGYTLSGYIKTEDNKPLPGASIQLTPGNRGVASGSQGEFRFSNIPAGSYLLRVSAVGAETRELSLQLESDTVLVIVMKQAVVTLAEVSIEGKYDEFRRENDARSVEIVNDEFIRKNMAGSLMQTLERLPGVNSMSIGSGQSKPVIRGLSFNQVIVAENGIKHESQQWGADHGVEVDQYDVEQAEVIKGPASLMYGSDAIAGVIDLRQTFVPEPFTAGGSLNLSGQSNNSQGALSLGLFNRNDKFWAKARFTLIDYADYRVPTDSIEYYSYYFRLKDKKLRNTAGGEKNGSLALGYIKGRFNSVLFVNNTFSKSGFFANAHGLEIRNSQIDYDRDDRDIDLPYQQVNHFKVHLRNTLVHAGLNHHIDLAWQNNKRLEFSEAVEHGYMPEPPDSLERSFEKQTLSFAWAVSNQDTGLIRFSAGINAERQDNASGGWGFILPSFRRTTAGAYLLGETRPVKKWLLLAGARFDAGFISTKAYSDWFMSPSDNGEAFIYKQRATASDLRFSHLSGSVGSVYKSEGLILKVNLGNSFRLPLAKELASDGVNYHMYRFEKGNMNLKPETAWQLDAGLELNRKQWAAEISPFLAWFPSYVYLNPTYQYYEGLQVFNYTQTEVLRAGGEIHLHYTIFRELKSGLIGEYVWSEQISGDKKGFGLPFSPPASVMFNLTYQPDPYRFTRDTWFSVDFKIAAAQNQTVPPEKKTPGYQILNLSAGTTITAGKQKIELSLRISNLLNSRYLNHTSYYRLIEVPEPGRGFQMGIKIPFIANH